jgi:DNA-directed RNA polymerase subunit RPC12/RpoP
MVVKCSECGNTKLNQVSETPEFTHYVCPCGSEVYVQKTESKPKPAPTTTSKKEPKKPAKSSKKPKEDKSSHFI